MTRKHPSRWDLFVRGRYEGAQAYRDGKAETDNPHKPGPYAMKYEGWRVGWWDERDKAEGRRA